MAKFWDGFTIIILCCILGIFTAGFVQLVFVGVGDQLSNWYIYSFAWLVFLLIVYWIKN